MSKFGYSHGDVSESLEGRVSEVARRHNIRFVVTRKTFAQFHFETNVEEGRASDGESALFAEIRANPTLYRELKQATDLFADEEIEF